MIADPVIADDQRRRAANALTISASIEDKQTKAYVDSRLGYYEAQHRRPDYRPCGTTAIVSLIAPAMAVEERPQFRRDVREFARLTREKSTDEHNNEDGRGAVVIVHDTDITGVKRSANGCVGPVDVAHVYCALCPKG